ncbi:MAG: hypothetical protein AAFR27_07405, partial [Pseudomonadota bacterium]
MPLRRVRHFIPEGAGPPQKKARSDDDVVHAKVHTAYKLERGGANIVAEFDGQKRVVKGQEFNPDILERSQMDTRSYFHGALKVHHTGNGVTRQYGGAPLPAKPVQKPALGYEPYKRLVWDQPDIVGRNMGQIGHRKAEASVMGESANDAIQRAGLRPKLRSPWAHTRPDHLNFQERTDPKLRVPAYVGANQVHSAFESAAKQLARNKGTIEVNRKVNEDIPGGSKLPVSMTLGYTLKNEQRNMATRIEHQQNYFTSAGARNGDERAIVMFVEHKQKQLDRGELRENPYTKTGTIDEMLERRLN